jgi:putative peptidoglycan lipid II flippase
MIDSDASPYLGHWLRVGALVLLGIAAGVMAQMAMAWRFGTDVQLDAFYVALLLASYFPIVFQTAVAEPFVPAYLNSGSQRRFAVAVLALTLAAGVAAALVLILGRRALVAWSSPGFTLSQAAMAHRDLVAMACIPTFYAVGLWLTSLLACQRRFVLARAAVMIVPVCQCIGILVGVPLRGVSALAWSTALGYFGYALVLWASVGFLSPLGARPSDLNSPAMRMLLAVGVPMAVTIAAGSLHALIDRSMVSHLGPGSISSLTYAERLNNVLCAVFLIPITFVALPHLSLAAQGREFGAVYLANLRATLLLFIPLAVVAGGFSFELVDVALRRGSFTEEDVAHVGAAFSAYMIGIPFYAVAALTGRAFVALRRTWMLAALAPLALILKVILNAWLIARYNVTGAALSTSFGYAVFSSATLVALVYVARFRGVAREIPTVLIALLAAATAFLVSDYVAPQYSTALSLGRRTVIVAQAATVFTLVYSAIVALYFVASRGTSWPSHSTSESTEASN